MNQERGTVKTEGGSCEKVKEGRKEEGNRKKTEKRDRFLERFRKLYVKSTIAWYLRKDILIKIQAIKHGPCTRILNYQS